jgi:hypothetical protein
MPRYMDVVVLRGCYLNNDSAIEMAWSSEDKNATTRWPNPKCAQAEDFYRLSDRSSWLLHGESYVTEFARPLLTSYAWPRLLK